MLALIDSDIVAYRCAWTTENEAIGIAKYRCDEMLEGILAKTNATEYQCWLSDSTANNFRTKFYPEYKANRKKLPKPKHLLALKEHLQKEWQAIVAIGEEADDALGISQIKWDTHCSNSMFAKNDYSVICTIDKDLKQIPGNHYNFVKDEFDLITPQEGLRLFYKQLLQGDASDNLQGAPGIGPKNADKLLAECSTTLSLFQSVVSGYRATYKKKIYKTDILTEEQDKFIMNQILVNGICLKIRQHEGEVWHFPE